jgi:hypothetical protein
MLLASVMRLMKRQSHSLVNQGNKCLTGHHLCYHIQVCHFNGVPAGHMQQQQGTGPEVQVRVTQDDKQLVFFLAHESSKSDHRR